LVPASLSYFVFDLSDRFFISHYQDLTQLGLYAMAINVTSIVPFFSMALSKAWLPMIFDLYHKEKEVFNQFMPKIFIYYLTFFICLAVGISFFGLEILKLLTVSKYYPAALAIGPLSLAMAFSATVQLTSTGIYLAKKTKLIALCSGLAAVVNVLFNFLLIPKFGMIGAAWATAISYFFLTNAYFWYSQKLVYIKLDWFRIIRLVVFGAVVIVLAPLSWQFSDYFNLIIKFLEIILFLILLIPLGIIKPEEIKAIKDLFSKAKEQKIDETGDSENSPVLK
jgi:O-antigen/teichoic acid export membrane protein